MDLAMMSFVECLQGKNIRPQSNMSVILISIEKAERPSSLTTKQKACVLQPRSGHFSVNEFYMK